jgi:hypothetical protein
MNESCPHSWVATGFFNPLIRAYQRKIPFIGVINTDRAGFQRWQTAFRTTYRVILDPKLTLIDALGGKSAPSVFEIAPGGRIQRSWIGLSKPILRDLNRRLAVLSKLPPAKLNETGVPNATQIGCSLH